jgi:hypothetical protein
MTELSFKASRFSSSIELDVLVVGFLMDSGGYVIFQQSLTKDAGISEPPYFEFNDQLTGGYDLVRSCAVTRSQVIIELSRPLNGITKFLVELTELEDDHQDIIDQLRKIFVGNENVLSIQIV